jgi:glycine hydroxymethyltransferase
MPIDNKLFRLLAQHEQWRMGECINLIPSENVTSKAVRALLASDLGHRYTLFVNNMLHGVFIKNAYGGTKYTDLIEEEAEKVTNEVFQSKYCSLKPLSGHVAGIIMLSALCEQNDLILAIDAVHGGYDGYMQEYMPRILGLKADYLPFKEEEWNLDVSASCDLIRKQRPKLVVIGASFILFPYDIKPLREACDDVGSYLGYDGSHVLGLIAGGEFQKPLADRADILIGSTHKTFFGPQGGLIVTNREDVYNMINNRLAWYTLDNPHQNRIAALGQTMLEFNEFGSAYAKQVINNSKTLAKHLADAGIPVKFGHKGFTESHQVLLDIEDIKNKLGYNPKELLFTMEEQNIIIDSIGRLGSNEMTRRGCKEEEMKQIGEFMIRVLKKKEMGIKPEIEEFIKGRKLEYCFDS